ncbi:hypothetical protein DL764_004934 [Monosporascus ibericus]|uniref:Uncharacterized protein n=1 Tax=Monosporascus ibericus TaxID=155417 RepID=A0A4V1XAS4_9PEZI|nr:hypothetical protein DL764_004934 [Monosporascus ibericus]
MKLYVIILALALGARAAQQDRDVGSWKTPTTRGPDGSPTSLPTWLEARTPHIETPAPWLPPGVPPVVPVPSSGPPDSQNDSISRDIPENLNPSTIPAIPGYPLPPFPPHRPRPNTGNPVARAVAPTKVLWSTPSGWYANTESTATATAADAGDTPADVGDTPTDAGDTPANPTLAGAASLGVAPAALVLVVAAWVL